MKRGNEISRGLDNDVRVKSAKLIATINDSAVSLSSCWPAVVIFEYLHTARAY